MKILSAEYIKSVARLEDLPRDRLPQIAFAGRSNVGKSTLLNVLFNRRNLAYVSSTPGKTQTLN
ncbi:MAG TPA: 50S ribosome-binding GTPase, partial [bacterium]|nr:50S ribosome-binding GTPase [bacterium]